MHMRGFLAACAGLAVLVLCGCATPPPAGNSGPPSGTDAYYVIGVAPKDVRLSIVGGTIRDGALHLPFIQLGAPSYMSDDGGYIVVKAEGGTSYGIVSAGLMFGSQSVLGEFYQPTGRTLVFNVPAGKVIYVTNLSYSRTGGGVLGMTQAPNINDARAFMRQHYPQLADRLEQGQFGFLPTRY